MKSMAFSVVTLLFAGSAFAQDGNRLVVPFTHQVVPAQGIYIKYTMPDLQYVSTPQKVTCIFENFYKGYLKYTENNVEKDSGIVFGAGNDSGEQFYFTNIGQTWTDTAYGMHQIHVDRDESVWVKNTPYSKGKAYATCFYAADESR